MTYCTARAVKGARLLAFATVCTFAALAAPPVEAAKRDVDTTRSREHAARKACLTGDYAGGVAILADLFIESRNPTYLFNQGRCYEQNRRYDDAIARFEEYLTVAGHNLSAEDREAAEKHISDCKEKLSADRPVPAPAAQALAPAAPPLPPAAPAPAAAPPPEPKPEPAAAVVVEHPKAAASDGSGMRIAGIVVASVGVAALAGGIVFNLKANQMVKDWQAKVSWTASQSDEQKTYQALSWVGYGVGAASLATGAILFAVGMSQRQGGTSVALVPALGPGQAGALLAGGF